MKRMRSWVDVVVRKFTPPGARLTSGVLQEDVDGDGVTELVAGYMWEGRLYTMVLKRRGSFWHKEAVIKGEGCDISYIRAVFAGSGERGDAANVTPAAVTWQEVSMSSVREPAQILLHPAPVKQIGGTRWGYIDESGRFVIPPTYGYANPFQENGLAIVEDKERYGVIDQAGRFVIQPLYEFIPPFSEGRTAVHTESGMKVVDETGKDITTTPYEYVSAYQEGRAVFQGKNMKYGYLDLAGKEVIPAAYEQANDFIGGQAVVKRKEKEYALLDKSGRVLHTYPYAFVGNLGDGLLAFQKEDQGKYGYMDETGRIVIEPSYSGTEPFREKRAVVNVADDYTNQYGLIDQTGAFIIKPPYNDMQRLGEHRVAVGVARNKEQPFAGSRYAIYTTDGKQLTDFIYDTVLPYESGLASVSNGTETFFIDSSGKKAAGWPAVRGDGTLTLEGNLIKAIIDQRTSYLDQAGKTVWAQNSVIPLSGAYQVQEKKYKPNRDYLVYYPQVSGMNDKIAEAGVNRQLAELSGVKEISETEQLDYSYTGDFDVPFFQKHLLVLQLGGYHYPFGAAHGMPTEQYAHVDLVSGQFYQLSDLFRKDSQYVKVLSEMIGQQIKNDPAYSYVWQDQYKGIKPDQSFSVTNDALYVYFAPYEIAAYVYGFPTFKIPYSQIMNIIDTEGAFWKSYK